MTYSTFLETEDFLGHLKEARSHSYFAHEIIKQLLKESNRGAYIPYSSILLPLVVSVYVCFIYIDSSTLLQRISKEIFQGRVLCNVRGSLPISPASFLDTPYLTPSTPIVSNYWQFSKHIMPFLASVPLYKLCTYLQVPSIS
jgi:hypothetical protein